MIRFLIKTLVIAVLAGAIFGGAWYYVNELYIRPQKELEAEKRAGPPPPPPEPSLDDFKKAVAVYEKGDEEAARRALAVFIDSFPTSSKIDEARFLLGRLNVKRFFDPNVKEGKEVYQVKPNDVVSRVAVRARTTPELIMRANNLTPSRLRILRIGQQLTIVRGNFSLLIDRIERRVIVLDDGKFFALYPIKTVPKNTPPKGTRREDQQKVNGRVAEKIAWGPSGNRVIFTDDEYAQAAHWIVMNVAGNTLYSDPDPDSGIQMNKPTSGLGLDPEHASELATLIRKGTPVTIL